MRFLTTYCLQAKRYDLPKNFVKLRKYWVETSKKVQYYQCFHESDLKRQATRYAKTSDGTICHEPIK